MYNSVLCASFCCNWQDKLDPTVIDPYMGWSIFIAYSLVSPAAPVLCTLPVALSCRILAMLTTVMPLSPSDRPRSFTQQWIPAISYNPSLFPLSYAWTLVSGYSRPFNLLQSSEIVCLDVCNLLTYTPIVELIVCRRSTSTEALISTLFDLSTSSTDVLRLTSSSAVPSALLNLCGVGDISSDLRNISREVSPLEFGVGK